MSAADLLFHCSYRRGLDADRATSDGVGVVPEGAQAPELVTEEGRAGARFGPDGCVTYATQGNVCREAGTVMMWFRPDWAWDFEAKLGRILWDLRIDHGSVVPDDPSQRYALVYPSIAGRGSGDRADDTFACWRLCVATNRNRYVIGTDEKRPDRRTRQALFSSPQGFAAGTWLHVAATWTATEGAIFVDGRLDRRGDLPEGLPDRPFPERFQVGAVTSWINAGPSGVLADVRLYGRALAEEEIAAAAATAMP